MGDTVTADEFRQERDKLEGDRAKLNEKLNALNLEREATLQQLAMTAGAMHTINHFLQRIDPEIDENAEIDMSELTKQEGTDNIIESIDSDKK
tara:strand:+ start:222 stop:500 length:279 start_codon:yes stop_codon:yes gene_type:complete